MRSPPTHKTRSVPVPSQACKKAPSTSSTQVAHAMSASRLLLAVVLAAVLATATAQLPPTTQPPLTMATCSSTQLMCGPADGQHRCCAAATSKCATSADGSPRCAFCQRDCKAGPLSFDCAAGFKSGLGEDGCCTCVPDPTGQGSFERPSPPPPGTLGQACDAATPMCQAGQACLGGTCRLNPCLADGGLACPSGQRCTVMPDFSATCQAVPQASAAETTCTPACGRQQRCVKDAATQAWKCVPRVVRPSAAITCHPACGRQQQCIKDGAQAWKCVPRAVVPSRSTQAPKGALAGRRMLEQ